jgi:IAA-amino acid hydrolase
MQRSVLPFLLLTVLALMCLPSASSSDIDTAAFSSIASETIISEIAALQNWTTSHRRALHQMPELMFDLHETSAHVQAVLRSLAIPFTLCARGVGIVADIGTGSAPCVALRADMDALPITETADVEFKSQSPGNDASLPPLLSSALTFSPWVASSICLTFSAGKMHACGHDSHTAMLLAAARVLKSHESSLRGAAPLTSRHVTTPALIVSAQARCGCCSSRQRRAAPGAWLC